jgi:tetratricopeptide (TPR) repeat protein
MGSINDFPERDDTHDTGFAAELAFESAIDASPFFLVQRKDRHDYGTDFQVEARDGRMMTNFRLHVQLKGTTSLPNSDGSVSVTVDRRNLNYLLAQPDALYVCFHTPSMRLFVREATDVFREYEHRSPEWRDQDELTVRFRDLFDHHYQRRIHEHLLADGKSVRDRRLEWTVTPPDRVPNMVESYVPLVEVPTDPARASRILEQLYNSGHDAAISKSFDRFAAVLAANPASMLYAHMSEINLGINGQPCNEERIRSGIQLMQRQLDDRIVEPGTSLYCQGNGWLALREFEKAREAYAAAFVLLDRPELAGCAAQCSKNMGNVMEQLGKPEIAVALYERALEIDPDLGEAHFALAQFYRRQKKTDLALRHLDAIFPHNNSSITRSSIQGWRVGLLIESGDIDGAFREIQSLTVPPVLEKWIWPYCAGQVAGIGRNSPRAARSAIAFWRSYLRSSPNHLAAEWQLLMCHWFLHQEGISVDMNFEKFKAAVMKLIDGKIADPAFLWDRIGHWAQTDRDWENAAEAFKTAYELKPERYGYCYGTALNFLGRFAQALPILTIQAERYQPDAMSWFQVGAARGETGDLDGSIEAYQKAIELDENYALARFNLGGMYWNRKDVSSAARTWREAIRRFPNHDQAKRICKQYAWLLELDEEEAP